MSDDKTNADTVLRINEREFNRLLLEKEKSKTALEELMQNTASELQKQRKDAPND